MLVLMGAQYHAQCMHVYAGRRSPSPPPSLRTYLCPSGSLTTWAMVFCATSLIVTPCL